MAFLANLSYKWALGIELSLHDNEPIKIPWWSTVYESFPLTAAYMFFSLKYFMHVTRVLMCVKLGAA